MVSLVLLESTLCWVQAPIESISSDYTIPCSHVSINEPRKDAIRPQTDPSPEAPIHSLSNVIVPVANDGRRHSLD
jgi:hypothetical protein